MTEDFKDVSGLLEEDRSKIDDKVAIGDKIDIVKPIIPIKPIRAPKFAAMRTMAEYPIPTPVTRKEMFLNVIAGGISELPTPKTREELYLAKICGMDVTIPIPLTRYEMYLYKLAGGEWDVPTPVTRLEIFLYHNCGYEIETPEPVTREEIYWNGGQPQPTTIEGIPPLTFTAKRTGNLEDYTIYGNTVQNGTPTPDSPIEPEFVGERTENLFDPNDTVVGLLVNGNIDLATTSRTSGYIPIPEGVDYVTACQKSTSHKATANYYMRIALFGSDKSYLNLQSYAYNDNTKSHTSVTRAITPEAKYFRVSYMLDTRDDDLVDFEPMLNLGSTALPYEPYGYKIPISSAGQTKNIYLGQVQTTRKIKKLVLTGEENWGATYYTYALGFDVRVYGGEMLQGQYTLLSTNYQSVITVPLGSERIGKIFKGVEYGTISAKHSVCVGVQPKDGTAQSKQEDIDDLKSYLAQQYANGTPVIVWYVLATPEVGIVNEPLCKIGDYADSVDFSQAGVEIPVTAGENTVSVGTEIQPSNMMISYK